MKLVLARVLNDNDSVPVAMDTPVDKTKQKEDQMVTKDLTMHNNVDIELFWNKHHHVRSISVSYDIRGNQQ